jgi:hypothetical protein
MGDQLQAASTTDKLEDVRAALGLPAEPTPEEKAEQQEMERERSENGHRDPQQSANFQRRFNKIYAQKSAAERRAEAAESERDELRSRLEQLDRDVNAPLDRALVAEARLAELEAQLRSYEQNGANGGYANAPPAGEQPAPEELPIHEAPPANEQPEQHAPPQNERQLRQQAHQKRFLDMVNSRPDADQLIERFVKIPVSPELEKVLSKAMLNTPNSAELAMHLLETPEAMERIARLSPSEAQWELARLSGRLEGANGQPRAVAVSHAPPPIRPLSGSAKTEPKDPGQMSLPEYRAWYDRNFSRGRR